MFMARFCPKRLYSVLKPAIDLMAGIPSIVYGFFGILVIVPAVHNLFGTSGKGTAHGVPAPGNDDIAYDYRSL